MAIEFELKYAASPELIARIRQDLNAPETQYAMHTTYYDTPSLALSQLHCTLRRRLENGISVCTLKTPAGKLGRGEFSLQCENIEDAIPELCKLSGIDQLPALTASGVLPVCGARFTRIAKTVALEDYTVEIALDQGILYGGNRESDLCEVEVELLTGSREGATLYAQTLAALYGLKTEKRSKFRRALALYKGE